MLDIISEQAGIIVSSQISICLKLTQFFFKKKGTNWSWCCTWSKFLFYYCLFSSKDSSLCFVQQLEDEGQHAADDDDDDEFGDNVNEYNMSLSLFISLITANLKTQSQRLVKARRSFAHRASLTRPKTSTTALALWYIFFSNIFRYFSIFLCDCGCFRLFNKMTLGRWKYNNNFILFLFLKNVVFFPQ